MLEKGIPFELKNEIPWHKDETITPDYNPLEKLPILLKPSDPSFEPVYDSSHIQEYLIQKHASQEPLLLTGDMDLDLKARQIQVLAQGIMDAFVLQFFEVAKAEEKRSVEWMGRQDRKVEGGFRALDEMVQRPRDGEYLIGDGTTYTIADIAAVCAVSQVEFGGLKKDWKEKYPKLASWWEKMDQREHFASTRPVMFDIKSDRIVA